MAESSERRGSLYWLVTIVGVVAVCLGALHFLDPDLGHGRGLRGLMTMLGIARTSVFNKEEITKTNAWLESLPPAEQPTELLKWAHKTIAANTWVQFTSFGPSGIVVTDLLRKLGLLNETKVIMIDTLHLFPETYDLMEKARDFFGLHENGKIFRCSTADSRAEFEKQFGTRIWRVAPKVYDYMTKIEPTRRALDQLGVQAWVTGRRRSQGGVRESLPLLEIDESDGRLKMNPLINWPFDDVWQHIRSNNLPYNALHDQGYSSVGDMVTTEKPVEGEGERGGRWKGSSKSECGMHVAQDANTLYDVAKLANRVRAGYTWDLKARERADAAGVLTVTEENFEQLVMKDQGHILLEMYAPWCPHCQDFEPSYNKVVPEARKVTQDGPEGVRLARMDRWQNKVPATVGSAFEMSGFPTMFLVLKDCRDRPILYDDKGHTVGDVMTFIRRHVRAGCKSAPAPPGPAHVPEEGKQEL